MTNVPAGATRLLHIDIATGTTFRGVISNMATAQASGFSISVCKLVRVIAP